MNGSLNNYCAFYGSGGREKVKFFGRQESITPTYKCVSRPVQFPELLNFLYSSIPLQHFMSN